MTQASFSQNGSQDGIATTTKKTFSRETTVSRFIKAPRDKVWSIITDGSQFTTWNSTITYFEGAIAKGQKVKLKSTLDEKRTFSLKVAEMVTNERMVWKDGTAPFFKGVRTYTLSETAGGTIFTMTEKIGGLMFPMAASSIPDFKESFEQFASDLKTESEK